MYNVVVAHKILGTNATPTTGYNHVGGAAPAATYTIPGQMPSYQETDFFNNVFAAVCGCRFKIGRLNDGHNVEIAKSASL